MTIAADTNHVFELAETYTQGPPAGSEHATLQAFFSAVSQMADRYVLADILAQFSEQDSEDELKTFVERTLLDQVARRPSPSVDTLRILFACLDYESLTSLAKNPSVDELNRTRARVEADRIKQAFLSRFE